MGRRTGPWTLLDAVARDLALALDEDRLSRELRQKARRLLMEAWLALKGTRRAATARAALGLARQLDELVAASNRPAVSGNPLPHPDRLGIAERLLTTRPAPLEDRLAALEGSVDSLARRTLCMVEKAESAALKAGILPSRTIKPGTGGGREGLELVWGDDET